MIVDKFHVVINSYQQTHIVQMFKNAAQMLLKSFNEKGGTQIFILINQKSAFCILSMKIGPFLGFVQVLAKVIV